MIARDARRRQHVAEERERPLPPEAVLRDGLADRSVEVGGAQWPVERGPHPNSIEDVVEDLPGEPFGVLVESVQWLRAHCIRTGRNYDPTTSDA
jgi:hypothetical protein